MSASEGIPADGGYPIGLAIDPPAPQRRLTIFFRLFLVIPHLIIVGLLGCAVSACTLVAWLVIVITGRYPAGLREFVVSVLQWMARAVGYMYLLTGVYPPFALGADASYPVRLSVGPDEGSRSRLTTLFRLPMAVPHLIVLGLLNYAIQVVVFFAWVVGVFTGSVPSGLHNFVAGFQRWSSRAYGYLLLLVDEYPPFSFS